MTPILDVILAEDNIVQRTYLARMIKHLGYRTIEAEDGREALELVRTTGAQILISDYHMPHLNGIEHFQKPPLIYWALGACGKVGTSLGLSTEAAFRFAPLH